MIGRGMIERSILGGLRVMNNGASRESRLTLSPTMRHMIAYHSSAVRHESAKALVHSVGAICPNTP
jgi:hypothetical protein